MNTDIPNTYQLEPKEDERFYPSKVRDVIKQVFESHLGNINYDPQTAHDVSGDLTEKIRQAIKTELKMNRYKVGIKVIFGEVKGQGIKVTSKCLWDPTTDNYTTYSYKNEKIYAVGIVYGCYCE